LDYRYRIRTCSAAQTACHDENLSLAAPDPETGSLTARTSCSTPTLSGEYSRKRSRGLLGPFVNLLRVLISACKGCPLKPQCCPNMPARRIPRSIYESKSSINGTAVMRSHPGPWFTGPTEPRQPPRRSSQSVMLRPWLRAADAICSTEASRVHHACRRHGSDLAARGASAAARPDAADHRSWYERAAAVVIGVASVIVGLPCRIGWWGVFDFS
jgi:hypothetical protein